MSTLEVSSNTRLDRLWHALKADAFGWRECETDEAQFDYLTHRALELQSASSPKAALEEELEPYEVLLRKILGLAQQGCDEALRRDPAAPDYLGSLWTALHVVANDISRTLSCLSELLELYEGHDEGSMRILYESKCLRWQSE